MFSAEIQRPVEKLLNDMERDLDNDAQEGGVSLGRDDDGEA